MGRKFKYLPKIIEEDENEMTGAEDNTSAVGEMLKKLLVTNAPMKEYDSWWRMIEEDENEMIEAEAEAQDNTSAVGEKPKKLLVTNTPMKEYERCNPLWGLTNSSPLASIIMKDYETNNIEVYEERCKYEYQFYRALLSYKNRGKRKKGHNEYSGSTNDWKFWQEYKDKVLKFYTALLLASVDDEDLFKPKDCDNIIQWISTNLLRYWTKKEAPILYRTILKCWDSFHKDFGMYDGSDVLSTDSCKKKLQKILRYGKDGKYGKYGRYGKDGKEATNLVFEEAFEYIKYSIEREDPPRKKYISRNSVRGIKIEGKWVLI